MSMQLRIAGVPANGPCLEIPDSCDSVQFLSQQTVVKVFNAIRKSLESIDLTPVRELFPEIDPEKLARQVYNPIWTLRDYGRMISHYDSFNLPPDGWNVTVFGLVSSMHCVLSVSYVVNRIWMPQVEVRVVFDSKQIDTFANMLNETGPDIATIALETTIRLARQPAYVKELQCKLLLRTCPEGLDAANQEKLEEARLLPWECEDCSRLDRWCQKCCHRRRKHIKKMITCGWCGMMNEEQSSFRKMQRCAKCRTGFVCSQKCFEEAKWLHYALCCTPEMAHEMELEVLAGKWS